MAYEIGVASLFRGIVDENMAMRRQLLQAGLSPPAVRSERPAWLPSAQPPVIPTSPNSHDGDADFDFADHSCAVIETREVRRSTALDPLGARSSRRVSLINRVSRGGPLHGLDVELFPAVLCPPFGALFAERLRAPVRARLGRTFRRRVRRHLRLQRERLGEVADEGNASDAEFTDLRKVPRHLARHLAEGREEDFAERTISALEGILVGKRASMPMPKFDDSMRHGSTFSDDPGASVRPRRRGRLKRIVRSFAFESFISACIILNCGTVGLWAHNLVTDSLTHGQIQVVEIAEHIFVTIFTIELLLKFKALGFRAFKPVDSFGRSNFMDMMLVVFTGIVLMWLVPLFGLFFDFNGSSGAIKTITVLRTFRLVRLVRVFQRMPLFREAWMLIHGLNDSSRTLFWTCVVIFLVTYIFAIGGLALIVVELESQLAAATDSEKIGRLQNLIDMMGGLDRMMALLVQVLMQDSFHAFVRDVLDFVWWSWIFWYSYLAVALIVLMNLVTAIIVENAIESSKADHDHMVNEKERNRQRDIDRMRKVFTSMDTDGGGTLSWEEFSKSFDDEDLSKMWKLLDIDQKDAWELFQLLDDGDGEITIDDFIEALQRMSGIAQAKDMFRLQKMLALVMNSLDTLATQELLRARNMKLTDMSAPT
eukprot:CAMPEP_0170223184 /NCGR_PEP_ID=MMETSP0116_2-20130129/11290_1 /TAXON_ID=400756 /ORGANISM="Durinskia baltica, Strain CSIRO CS-38" /LENGTH=651 /DNA_ID=CAMNT_0010473883 /DNA_START=279 /DNA_END=2235 /DNA_ORIENTATION=-